MSLFSLKHTPTSYSLDFALYAVIWTAIATTLLIADSQGYGVSLLLYVCGGIALWSLLEYLLHRFVLHGIAPFSQWHDQHHLQPKELIATPMLLSLLLFFLLGALPAWWLIGSWPALALMLGLLGSYLVYGLIHHATHHTPPFWIRRNGWMSHRRICHAMHHAAHQMKASGEICKPCHFGVSSGFWDKVFGSNILLRPLRIEK